MPAGTIIQIASATVLSAAFIALGVRVFRENRKPRGIPATDVWARIDAMREARAHGDVVELPREMAAPPTNSLAGSGRERGSAAVQGEIAPHGKAL